MALTNEERVAVVAKARECIGAKFVHRGRHPLYGIDCIGVVLWGLSASSWEPIDRDAVSQLSYSREAKGCLLSDIVDVECDRVSLEDALPGDLVVMRWDRNENPQHLALVSRITPHGVYIIHSDWYEAKVSEHVMDSMWKNRILAIGRIK